MLNPFIDLFGILIELYTYCVIGYVLLKVLISVNVVNRQQQHVMSINYALNRLVGPALRHIRKFTPNLGTIDISPIILILLLGFLRNVMYHYFYNL